MHSANRKPHSECVANARFSLLKIMPLFGFVQLITVGRELLSMVVKPRELTSTRNYQMARHTWAVTPIPEYPHHSNGIPAIPEASTWLTAL